MDNLNKLIEKITSHHIYIQTHNFPDPDAIGSGYGLKCLLEQRGLIVTLCYGGAIDRINTQRMVELFNIDMVNIDELDNMTENDEIILVDAHSVGGNVTPLKGRIIAAIDHHPVEEECDFKFCDIREQVGACASIVASYYLEEYRFMPQSIAEALLYGINMDTANLTRGVTNLDLDMFYHLYNIADRKNLEYLESNEIQRDDLGAYVEAINSMRFFGNISFASTGENCSKALIAIISDFTSKISEIEFSVVYSIKKDGIRMSVRSSNRKLSAGEIVSEALKGIGSGGGHTVMAGGFVPFVDNDLLYDDLIKLIEDRIVTIVKSFQSESNR